MAAEEVHSAARKYVVGAEMTRRALDEAESAMAEAEAIHRLMSPHLTFGRA